uniref:Bromo domain-containing protein n=1 Tax=Salix viminalis TaxID=40686 RepID=A0A6N2LVU4_SALVM
MASESVVGEGGNEGGEVREKQRYTESKVYTRKAFKGLKKNSLINTAITTTTTTDNNSNTNITTTTTTDNNSNANIITTTTAATGETDVNTTTTTATATTETATAPTTTAATRENDINTTTTTATATTETATAPTTTSTAGIATATKTTSTEATETATGNETNDKENYEKDLVEVREPEPVAVEDTNTGQQVQQPVSHSIVVSDNSTRLNREEVQEVVPSTREQVVERELPVGNGVLLKEGLDNRVKVNLLSRSKQEKRELRKKLESELELVRSLVKKIEAKELQLSVGRLSHSRVVLANDGVDRRLRRVNSEVGSVGVHRESTTPIFTPTPRQFRPLNQLSISVLENSQGVGEFVEKEKRTPKANQFYRNSEFLLAKDKFPPAESNKKSKLNGRKQGAGELGFGFGTGTKVFKNCSALLDKLMKHKHGWVFNTPVDVTGLGLHDYFTIIKHPMDLGTVKSRLTKNWYKSPEEFAEDVRLTFHNAMTYNPEGQDVHVMAEQLLDIFETKWSVIKSDYDHEMRFAASYEVGIPTPTSRKNPFVPPPLDMRRILDRSVSMPYPIIDTRPKPITTTPSGRTPVPKKPKAKDPNKRDMTYDEKQKLSTNLQSLPSEKLDNIVQIIKKRSSALSQHDDEIEVDIDSVDVETLWELDRFVTNYKKSLSKNKRKAELAIQARAESQLNVQQKVPAPVLVEAPKETKADERNVSTLSPNHVEKQGDNGSRSSSSSSSSSDSGSSSSGNSDSDSSSASGSDISEFRVNAFWISILIRNLPLVYSEVLKATDCSDSAK